MTTPKETIPVTDPTAKIEIRLSEAAPVRIVAEDWPIIATTTSPVTGTAAMHVRRHADGRVLVYGERKKTKDGDDAFAGFLLSSGETTDENVLRSIRRVAGIVGNRAMAERCVAAMPPRDI